MQSQIPLLGHLRLHLLLQEVRETGEIFGAIDMARVQVGLRGGECTAKLHLGFLVFALNGSQASKAINRVGLCFMTHTEENCSNWSRLPLHAAQIGLRDFSACKSSLDDPCLERSPRWLLHDDAAVQPPSNWPE